MANSNEPPLWRPPHWIVRWTLVFAAVSGLLAVGLGAWSAHGAQQALDPQAIEWMRTGVQYQAWHSAVMLGVGILLALWPGRFLPLAAAAFALGIVLFSGSLYGLALTHIRAFAFATPFGGMGFIAGWLLLAIHALTLGRQY